MFTSDSCSNSNLALKATDATYYQTLVQSLTIDVVAGHRYCIFLWTNSTKGNIILTTNVSGCTILNQNDFSGTKICDDGASEWDVYRYPPLVIEATESTITIKSKVTSNYRIYAYVLEI